MRLGEVFPFYSQLLCLVGWAPGGCAVWPSVRSLAGRWRLDCGVGLERDGWCGGAALRREAEAGWPSGVSRAILRSVGGMR